MSDESSISNKASDRKVYLKSMKTYKPLHRSSNDAQKRYFNIRSDIEQMCNESFERDTDWYYTMFDIIEHLQEQFQASGNKDNRKLYMKAIGMAYSCMVNNDTRDLLEHYKLIEGIFHKLNNPHFKTKSRLGDKEIHKLIYIYKQFVTFYVMLSH